MRIGIITLPLRFNYGGILQAYAIEEILRRYGHYVEHVEIKQDRYLLPFKTRYLVYLKRALLCYVKRDKSVRVFQEQYLHDAESFVIKFTNAFMDKYLRRRFIKSYDEISSSDYDAFVVGSDQVWRSEYICKKRNFAPFLDFTQGWDVTRLAYACSFAREEWTFDEQAANVASLLLKSFDEVSVRELSGVKLCKDYLNINAKHVLDPTMLLDKNDYISLVNKCNTKQSPGSLLCYILDETATKIQFINKVANDRGLTPFRANSKAEDLYANITDRIQPPVEQWLRGFIDAELVITDSFHACVFSMIFNKPFICLGNHERGTSRFISLLGHFNQIHRLIDSAFDINDSLYEAPNVDITAYRENSIKLFRDL